MFVHSSKLPHLLEPAAYFDSAFFESERNALFSTSWHFFTTRSGLRQSGDYLARDILGTPVVVRNDAGSLSALQNVCAHRHSMIVAEGPGNAATLKCMYHGWEYAASGCVAHIPDGKCFKGIRADNYRLPQYSVDTLGEMVFVNLSGPGHRLTDSWSDLHPELEHYYRNSRLVWNWVTDHEVNWKVIAENAVESYHVPAVHQSTFGDYRDEVLHDHCLAEDYSRYADLKPWDSSFRSIMAKSVLKMLSVNPNFERFKQTHLFPNFLLYYGDLFSSFIILEPLSATRTRHIQLGFVPKDIKFGVLGRAIQNAFAAASKVWGKRVMKEDMRIWRSIQHGLEHSPHAGVLSAREERVFHFQHYLDRKLNGEAKLALLKTGANV